LLLPARSRVSIYLPNLRRGYEALFENRAQVVWARRGREGDGRPRGMGLRFLDLSDRAQAQLDAFVVDALEKRLAGAHVHALAPAWVARECVAPYYVI
jgi:c-di-GMP-binding flagellar brake protein YcgR